MSNVITGADWQQFNKEHIASHRHTVLVYGNKRQLYKQYQLLLAATSHAALPVFCLQVRLLMSTIDMQGHVACTDSDCEHANVIVCISFGLSIVS